MSRDRLEAGLVGVQYALQTGTHPAVTTARNIDRFREQLQSLGEPSKSNGFGSHLILLTLMAFTDFRMASQPSAFL